MRNHISQILKTFLDDVAELSVYEVSGCQLFRLYSRKLITRRLLMCAARSRHVFYPQNLTATYRADISAFPNPATLTSLR